MGTAILILASCKNNPTISVQGSPESNPLKAGKGKYALKSGIVEYKTKVMGMDATQLTFFDDYGGREATDMTMEFMGNKIHTITITKDGYYYTIDPQQKTGKKVPVSMKQGEIDFENLTDRIQQEMKIKKVGEETFLGKHCIRYSIENEALKMKGYYLVWNGIPLKTDVDLSTMKMVMDAMKVEENPNVPAEKFEISAGIVIKE